MLVKPFRNDSYTTNITVTKKEVYFRETFDVLFL